VTITTIKKLFSVRLRQAQPDIGLLNSLSHWANLPWVYRRIEVWQLILSKNIFLVRLRLNSAWH